MSGSRSCSPIRNPLLRKRIFDEILQSYLRDDDKSRILRPDGSYVRAYQATQSKLSRNGNRFSAQTFFIDLAEGRREGKLASAASAELELRSLPLESPPPSLRAPSFAEQPYPASGRRFGL